METENQLLRQISLGAYSRSSIHQAILALAAVQRRYPAIASMPPSRSDSVATADDENTSFLRTESSFVEYVARYADTVPSADGLSEAAWSMAQQQASPRDAVQSYLDLLRHLDSPVEILPVRPLQNEIALSSEGTNRPAIIPFVDDDTWVFAVAYPDCVHWYDSGRDRHIPSLSSPDKRAVTNHWTGPKHERNADSSIFMLMGIRCIQRGSPHLPQETAVSLASTFRARVVVELLCGKIDPPKHSVEMLLMQEVEEQSLFFEDAMNGMDWQSSPSPDAETENGFVPLPLDPPSLDANRIPPSTIVSLAQPACKRVRQEHGFKVADARIILANLNEASLATRAIVRAAGRPLDILWLLVQNTSYSSAFHDRLNAILFYEEMKRYQTDNDVKEAMKHPTDVRDMRIVQARCKFWKDICEIRSEWGEDKYVLLLAFPRTVTGRTGRSRHIQELERRLNNGDDHIQRYLHAARDICRAIVRGSLPCESLMIDVYHLKQHEPLSDSMFDAFVSVKPRARVPLPRLAM
ncbi:hypothetical protein NQ176_g1708 [Zarea fungicola]|uniref:Uncharacterized protein n=1 Tax=Zarea fungicola TaxID=93591 RepID=A0ACC1NU65_9HYPO|nr:hypothetical protein NQ176_g1708 [Lecanicillium fungicola]